MAAKARYRVIRPITYPALSGASGDAPERRRRMPGAVVDNVPAESVAWLVAQGAIVPVERRATMRGGGGADVASRKR